MNNWLVYSVSRDYKIVLRGGKYTIGLCGSNKILFKMVNLIEKYFSIVIEILSNFLDEIKSLLWQNLRNTYI